MELFVFKLSFLNIKSIKVNPDPFYNRDLIFPYVRNRTLRFQTAGGS